MTKEEIIEMAREAGGIDLTNTRANVTIWIGTGTSDFLDAFAKLAAVKEREACAKLCDVLAVHPEYASEVTKLAAQAIRNRGQA